MNWIVQSNRPKHFWYSVPIALFLTILFVAGLGVGMEFKDKSWGGKWDWADFSVTIVGVSVGYSIRVLCTIW